MKSQSFRRTAVATSVRTMLGISGTALALIAAGPVAADEIGDLKDQVNILMQRIEQLEQQQNEMEANQDQLQSAQDKMQDQVEAVPANVVTGGDTPGTFKLPGTNTEVEVSGYIKGDLIFDLDADVGDSFTASSIPADGTVAADRNPHTRFHAKQSRLRVRTTTPMDNGKDLKTHLEGDFLGAGGNQSFSNSTTFRLRHAYASYGGLLVGQTWSNFMDFVAYPTTVDFFGPAGKSFVRQGQIRWTTPNGFSVSLENPETDGLGAAGRLGESRGGIGSDELPDLTVAWRGGPGGAGGSYEFAGLLRQLGVNGVAPAGSALAGTRIDDDEVGWGVNLAGGWTFGDTTLSASTTFGEGIGRYIINGFANDVFVNTDGSIEAVESLSVNAAIHHSWSPTSSSLLAFGHFENDDPTRSNGIDEINTVHLNYMWNPYPSTTFGIEAIYGELDNADGTSGDATRIQFGVQQNF